MRDNGGTPRPDRPPWIRSKARVLLLLLGVMVLMVASGVVYRIVRPPEEDRILDELPLYPGAQPAEAPASDPTAWSQFGAGFADAVVVPYVLPAGTSRDDVLRYYGTHMPASFRRVGASCWSRGDARVLLVLAARSRPVLDVAVATGDAECPGE